MSKELRKQAAEQYLRGFSIADAALKPEASWRNQVLTAHFGNDKTLYTEGIV